MKWTHAQRYERWRVFEKVCPVVCKKRIKRKGRQRKYRRIKRASQGN